MCEALLPRVLLSSDKWERQTHASEGTVLGCPVALGHEPAGKSLPEALGWVLTDTLRMPASRM